MAGDITKDELAEQERNANEEFAAFVTEFEQRIREMSLEERQLFLVRIRAPHCVRV